jgi:anti-repressor protein
MNAITLFQFEKTDIREITDEQGEPWFVLRDLLDAMQSKTHVTDAIKSIEQGLGKGYANDLPLQTAGGIQTVTIVSEPAATFLLARSNTDQGRKLNRFIHTEVLPSIRKTGQFVVPTTLADALQLAADQARRIDAQTAQIAVMEPKADFHDRVTQSQDLLTIREVAKLLRTGERRMFGFLRREGLLMASNLPYQQFMNRGLFRLVETPWTDQFGRERISVKTCVTQKGLAFIQGLQDKLAMYQDTAA